MISYRLAAIDESAVLVIDCHVHIFRNLRRWCHQVASMMMVSILQIMIRRSQNGCYRNAGSAISKERV